MSIKMEYERMRFKLLVHNYIFHMVKERFRKKYKVNGIKSEKDLVEYFINNHADDLKKFFSKKGRPTVKEYKNKDFYQVAYRYDLIGVAFPEISDLEIKLQVNLVNLIDLLIFDREVNNYSTPNIIFLESCQINSKDKRSFIAIDIDTTEEEVIKAKNMIQRLQKMKKSYKKKRKKALDSWDDESIQTYLKVEKELLELSKLNKEDIEFDYGKTKEFTGLALERIGGDKKKNRNHHYEITRRYNLPTERKHKELLELIPL